ncbi:MAG: hypothetical protein ACRDTT_15865 [Pseudonocardiaceae bacterium]
MQRKPCTDVVVVVPGILGSALAVDGQPVWELSGAALLRGLRTCGTSAASTSARSRHRRLSP